MRFQCSRLEKQWHTEMRLYVVNGGLSERIPNAINVELVDLTQAHDEMLGVTRFRASEGSFLTVS